jgi:hypothetical protein
VIARCLAKEPEGRYADYAALRDALLPFSSVVPEPATQAQRGAAGWIDYLSGVPADLRGAHDHRRARGAVRPPALRAHARAWQYHLMVFGAGFSTSR